jgi:hypothetical protein
MGTGGGGYSRKEGDELDAGLAVEDAEIKPVAKVVREARDFACACHVYSSI